MPDFKSIGTTVRGRAATELRNRIQTNVNAMASHGEFIANYCGAAQAKDVRPGCRTRRDLLQGRVHYKRL